MGTSSYCRLCTCSALEAAGAAWHDRWDTSLLAAPLRSLGGCLLHFRRELTRRIAQGRQVRLAVAQLAGAQVGGEGAAHLGAPVGAELLLKRVGILGVNRAEQAPGPEPQIVERALELRQARRTLTAALHLRLQRIQHVAQGCHLIRPSELTHGTSCSPMGTSPGSGGELVYPKCTV